MGQRSKIYTVLTPEHREELNKRLLSGGFGDYEGLAEWLKELGYEIHKSAIWRYGSQYEEACAAAAVTAQQLRSLVETVGDDALAFGEGAYMLAIQKGVEALMKINDESMQKESLARLMKSIADLNKSAVPLKKYASEVREKVDRKFQELEQKAAGGTEADLDLATIRKIREQVYGIFTAG